jgi:hypothetical protein
MVEADSHLKLLPTSILDIYKVFEHIDKLSIGIWLQPYTVIPPSLGQILGFWVICGVTSGLMLTATSTDSHLHLRHYKVFEYINMLSIGI